MVELTRLDKNFYPMNVNEARIFTTPALHAKSTRKDVLRKLTFHFKPKLKVFNQTKYLIQNINRHIKRILLFLKLLAILYVVTFVVFIGFTVLQIAIYHFRLAVHMTYSVLLCHDDVRVNSGYGDALELLNHNMLRNEGGWARFIHDALRKSEAHSLT